MLKILHISFHKGCQNDLEYISKKLNFKLEKPKAPAILVNLDINISQFNTFFFFSSVTAINTKFPYTNFTSYIN